MSSSAAPPARSRWSQPDSASRQVAVATAAPWRDRVGLVRAHGALVGPATALLVRPDGYLAWSGDHADGAQVRTALTQWCGNPGS
jgi:hypothetical protein